MLSSKNLRLTALAGVIALLSGSAFAAEKVTDETRVDVRTKAGIESLIVSDLKPGETRPATTAAGHPALVTRTADGLKIEIGAESFAVNLPDLGAGGDELANLGPNAKVIRIDKDVERSMADSGDGSQKKVVVIKHHGPVDDKDIDVIARATDGDLPPMADGQNIRVTRMIKREVTETRGSPN